MALDWRSDRQKVLAEETANLSSAGASDRYLARAVMIAGMFIADAIEAAAEKETPIPWVAKEPT